MGESNNASFYTNTLSTNCFAWLVVLFFILANNKVLVMMCLPYVCEFVHYGLLCTFKKRFKICAKFEVALLRPSSRKEPFVD